MKIALAGERDGKSCRAGSSIPRHAQSAQNGVELAQLAGVKIHGERRRAGARISAQMAASHQLAGRQIKFQLAQIDRAVALGVGGVNLTAGGRLVRHNLRRRSEAKQGLHGECAVVAVNPQCGGRAVEARVEA